LHADFAWLYTWDTNSLQPRRQSARSQRIENRRNRLLVVTSKVKSDGQEEDPDLESSPLRDEFRSYLLTGSKRASWPEGPTVQTTKARSTGRLSGRSQKPRPGLSGAKQAEGRRMLGVAVTSGLLGLTIGMQPQDDSDEKYDSSQVIDMLQGQWEDEIRITIRISGRTALFSDDPSREYTIEESSSEGLILREARLMDVIGSDDNGVFAAVWRFPWGQEHQWERLTRDNVGDQEWDAAFHEYKSGRLDVWRELSMAAEDGCGRGTPFQKLWHDGGPFPSGLAAFIFRSRLLAGTKLVPGICFLHKTFGYRGVILGHDSKCIARTSWKEAMGVDEIPGGENQPYYHCIVDERDRPGGEITYVAEVNMIPDTSRAFPIQADLVQAFFIMCEEARGYIPRKRLAQLLDEQSEQGGRFMI